MNDLESRSADLMLQLSVTLSHPEPQFQGPSLYTLKANISQAVHATAKYISAFCVYYSEDNITTFSIDTNVARTLSNS